MAAGGWYRMHRGWQDDPLFAGDAYSRRDAWEWLIANAAWEPHARWFKGRRILLRRGQLASSERELCAAWKWERQRVRTFLRHLAADHKLARETAHGLTLLSLCNYDHYQAETTAERTAPQAARSPLPNLSSTPPGVRPQPTREEGEKGKEEREPGGSSGEGGYAFHGKIIRLAEAQLARWRLAYPAIDLIAVLQARDDWLALEADEALRRRWFIATSNYLAGLQQRATAARQEAANDRERITI